MAEREKYYIGLNGQTFEVSKDLYEAYYKGQRKEKYFTHDLKHPYVKPTTKKFITFFEVFRAAS